ncbi:MAG: hypothetical protein HQM09_23340 [Candidatus Riflebacteria bacterium]|nr:hypothetical protein [Candidatus Riflebacteria bacterium]
MKSMRNFVCLALIMVIFADSLFAGALTPVSSRVPAKAVPLWARVILMIMEYGPIVLEKGKQVLNHPPSVPAPSEPGSLAGMLVILLGQMYFFPAQIPGPQPVLQPIETFYEKPPVFQLPPGLLPSPGNP